MLRFLSSLALMAVVVIGCGKGGDASNPNLIGTWKIVRTEPAELLSKAEPFLRFKDGKIETPELRHVDGSVTLSCAVPYQADGKKIRVTAGRHTNCTMASGVDIEVVELTDAKLTLRISGQGRTATAFYEKAADRVLHTSATSRGDGPLSTRPLEAYFIESARQISVAAPFDLNRVSGAHRFTGFHSGRPMTATQVSNDGVVCAFISPNHTGLNRVTAQRLRNSRALDQQQMRQVYGVGYHFYGIRVDYTNNGDDVEGWLMCARQERHGAVTVDDFKRHFGNYVTFGE